MLNISIFWLLYIMTDAQFHSPEDQAILEAEYKANPKPDKAARLEIVKRVSLSEKAVQVRPTTLCAYLNSLYRIPSLKDSRLTEYLDMVSEQETKYASQVATSFTS